MTEITEWSDDKIRTSILKSNALPCFSFEVNFRQFTPREGDQLERHWVEGKEKKVVKIPPYAIASMAETAASFLRAVDGTTFECIDEVLSPSHVLVRRTFQMTKQHHLTAPVC
jgi:hypothetical protein